VTNRVSIRLCVFASGVGTRHWGQRPAVVGLTRLLLKEIDKGGSRRCRTSTDAEAPEASHQGHRNWRPASPRHCISSRQCLALNGKDLASAGQHFKLPLETIAPAARSCLGWSSVTCSSRQASGIPPVAKRSKGRCRSTRRSLAGPNTCCSRMPTHSSQTIRKPRKHGPRRAGGVRFPKMQAPAGERWLATKFLRGLEGNREGRQGRSFESGGA